MRPLVFYWFHMDDVEDEVDYSNSLKLSANEQPQIHDQALRFLHSPSKLAV